MLERIERHRDAEVVVFSEMCVPGYLIGDAWEIDALAIDFASWSEVVREASRGLTVLFGNVAVDPSRPGEDGRLRKYNAVYVCHDAEYVVRAGVPGDLPCGVHPKTLHPNYRFFDDDRHFHSVRKLAVEHGPGRSPTGCGRTRCRAGPAGASVSGCRSARTSGARTMPAKTGCSTRWRCGGEAAPRRCSISPPRPWTWEKNDKRHRTVREVLAGSPIPVLLREPGGGPEQRQERSRLRRRHHVLRGGRNRDRTPAAVARRGARCAGCAGARIRPACAGRRTRRTGAGERGAQPESARGERPSWTRS